VPKSADQLIDVALLGAAIVARCRGGARTAVAVGERVRLECGPILTAGIERRAEREAEAGALGVKDRVRILGFLNQSQLPAFYSAGDLLVVSSEQDACPVVVCEAMLCGTPVVLSDEVKGRFDLVESGNTGFVYPCGDIEQLAVILRQALGDRENLQRLGKAALRRMETWSPEENVEAWAGAFERAVNLRASRNKS